jgi:tRNA (cmo5U34)-methyltransferase
LNTDRLFGGEQVQNYDRGIRKMVPGYEALHSMARSLLRLDLEDRASLLIVGAGTGTEILGLGEGNPGWRFTGVDPSSDMLAIARKRVAERGFQNRVELHTGFVYELPASPPHDAATAILVMHFLPDDGQKLDFLRSISARLKPGAPLILADLHGDETSARFAHFIATWRERQLALGMAREDVDEAFRTMSSHVHSVPEGRIVALMHEAGLHSVERFYNALLFGGWIARGSADA